MFAGKLHQLAGLRLEGSDKAHPYLSLFVALGHLILGVVPQAHHLERLSCDEHVQYKAQYLYRLAFHFHETRGPIEWEGFEGPLFLFESGEAGIGLPALHFLRDCCDAGAHFQWK